MTKDRGFKSILAAVASAIAILVAIQPYLNVVATAKSQETKLNLLDQQQKTDHDLIIHLSADIGYIKDTVKELKERR